MGKKIRQADPSTARGARLWAFLAISAAVVIVALVVTVLPQNAGLPHAADGRDSLRDAKVAFVDGNLDEAERLLRTLSGPEAQCLLGRVLLERGRNEEAARIFGPLLKEDARNVDATRGMAVASQRMDRLELAGLYWTRAAELRPKDPGIWKELGICLRQKGDTIGALNAFQQSLALEPNQPELSSRIGELAAAGAHPVPSASPTGMEALVPRPRDPMPPGRPPKPSDASRAFPLSAGWNR